jgi:leucine-rich repeat protein SHOC2
MAHIKFKSVFRPLLMIPLKKVFFLSFLYAFFLSLPSYAQEIDLSKEKTFKNLEKALQNPEEVYKLDLSGQKLKVFPEEILQLKNLRELNLSKNKLKEIPDAIRELKELSYLNLSKNKLQQISKGICDLKKLNYLDMSQNRIQGFPEEIGQLRNLKKMDMWSNDFSEFPTQLSMLRSLEVLDLRSIQMSQGEQAKIKTLLPNAKIYFSQPCRCDF